MRRIALIATLLAATAATWTTVAGADDTREYEIEVLNAFGIVPGSDMRVAGVNVGSVLELEVNAAKRAVVTVELSGELAELGEDSECTTEPQSLIAEYFIDCTPKGPPLAEDDDGEGDEIPDPDIPYKQVTQTVQNDIVANTLREPYKQRLALLINEFGTALAGNPENLNEAIRLGAPTLTSLRKVTRILGNQNTIIRDLNADSDLIIAQLNDRREDIVRAIQEIEDTSAASAERRADLARDFEILDDFLAELRPTLGELTTVAREQTPLLADLRAAAPGLTTLSENLPDFNDATADSLTGLGEAADFGKRAVRRGGDEIKALAESGVGATTTGEILADLLRDLDDPRRAVEIDERVGLPNPGLPGNGPDTDRTNTTPGQPDTMGYTGLEGLLNYVYYQATSTNQFDQVGHLLHFSLYDFEENACGHWSSGREPTTGAPGVPDDSGPPSTGTTTDVTNAAPCVAWLGDNQPGFTGGVGPGSTDPIFDPGTGTPFDLPPLDQSACPDGTDNDTAAEGDDAAAEAICPGFDTLSAAAKNSAANRERRGGGGGQPDMAQPAPGGGDDAPGPQVPGVDVPRGLDDLLDLPRAGGRGGRGLLDDLPRRLQEDLSGGGGGAQGAVQDLLDFLFAP
jgi:ABC-type transporter Mla subunit MlaD